MLQTDLPNRRPLLSMPLPMFVMMPVRLAFIAIAIQILAVLMVLRVQLQGNVRDAFGLHQTLHRLAHALRVVNGHAAVQHQMGGEQMAVAGERP